MMLATSMVKLDSNLLRHFDVSKLRTDCLMPREQLYEVWGSKLEQIIERADD